ENLFVEVPFGVERSGAGHLDQVEAPFAFGAMQLDVSPAAAHPLPCRKRQILHATHADVAKDRNAFALHEKVVRCLRPAEFSKARAPPRGRFVPMHSRYVMHGGCSHTLMTCGDPQPILALLGGGIKWGSQRRVAESCVVPSPMVGA